MKDTQFPCWEDAISGITDSRFTKLPDKNIVRSGARIMYDRLYAMLVDSAILTSAMHGDIYYIDYVDTELVVLTRRRTAKVMPF